MVDTQQKNSLTQAYSIDPLGPAKTLKHSIPEFELTKLAA